MDEEPLVTREELTGTLFRIQDIAVEVQRSASCRRRKMAKNRKPDREMSRRHAEHARRFQELLEKRVETDRRLAAERERRERERGSSA
jgi:hypothetical protein